MLNKTISLEDLNKFYSEGESVDQQLFAEYRSNVLLVSGDHYIKSNSNYFHRIRDAKQLSSELKLKISINYIQRITKQIVNGIMTYAPNVRVYPKNLAELQDLKSAELNQAVWSDLDHRHKLKARRWEHAEDFVNIGETFCEIFFDPQAGTQIPAQPVVDEMGQMVIDPMTGQPMMGEPSFSGDILFKRHFAFNVLRAPEALSLDQSRFFVLRELVSVSDLKRMVEGDASLPPEEIEEKVSKITESSKQSFLVFEGQSGNYRPSTAKEVLLKKVYHRPCADYPNGYWAIFTDAVKLWEGELPKSKTGKVIFPLVYEGFDKIPTSARARSIIKQLRPGQVELNRCISQIATDQLLGSDKVIYQAGTKFTAGSNPPGFRGYQFTGLQPQVIQGNQDARYLAYVEMIIRSMYEAANLDIDSQEKTPKQGDPWSMIYQSLANKKRYSMYAEKFESFLVRTAETALELAKIYYSEEMMVAAVGRNERINVQEFKSTDDLSYSIKVVEQSGDIESVMGKALMGQTVLQYVGKQLGKEDIGRVMRNMPYLDTEESFGGLALNYDSIKNDILALDRGKWRPAHPTDEHPEFIKAFMNRKRKADFEFLPPQVQQMYDQRVQMHEQMLAEQEQKILEMKNQMVPSGGLLVGVDLYIPGGGAEGKLKRAKLPQDSVLWLIQTLEKQGKTQEMLESLNKQALVDMAGQMGIQAAQGMGGQGMPSQSMLPQGSGQSTYGGVNPNGV